MAVESLIASLERDAEREAVAQLEAAQARADAIRREAAAEVAARRRRFFAQHEPAMRAQAMRQLARVRHDANAAMLAARHQALDRLFATTLALLDAPGPLERYAQDLAAHLERALAYVDDRPATVHCRPALADPVRTLLRERADVTVAPAADAAPGLVVRTTDGRLCIDDTLAGRLARRWPSLTPRLVRRLDERT